MPPRLANSSAEPPRPVKSRFQLFKEKKSKNPMQEARAEEEGDEENDAVKKKGDDSKNGRNEN